MEKKAQSAIEFFIITGSVFFFFISFLFVIQSNISDKVLERRSIQVQEIALIIREEVSLAFESSDGYSRNFKIPEKIDGLEYSVIISDGFVFVMTEDEKHAVTFPIMDVTGQPEHGDNYITKNSGIVSLNLP